MTTVRNSDAYGRTWNRLTNIETGRTLSLEPGEVAETDLPEGFSDPNLEILESKTDAPTGSVAELRKWAEDLGLEVPAKATKADLARAIAAAEVGGKAPDNSEDEDAGDGEGDKDTDDDEDGTDPV